MREALNDKVIVTIAPTGGALTKNDTPHVPTQPQEIAEDVYRCFNAGASMAALHARTPDDRATCDPAIYRDINDRIRQRCDVIINNSSGGGLGGQMVRHIPGGLREIDWNQRLAALDAGADTCTLDPITAWGYDGQHEVLMNTPPSRARDLAALMATKGIKPEWEAFSPTHIVQDISTLIAEGYDTAPHLINIVLGVDRIFQGAMPYSSATLGFMIDLLPRNSMFIATVAGEHQLAGAVQAILLGGHVRVGLEDNLYYRPGQLGCNAAFVERIVAIIRALGREPATPAEARMMLNLRCEAPV